LGGIDCDDGWDVVVWWWLGCGCWVYFLDLGRTWRTKNKFLFSY